MVRRRPRSAWMAAVHTDPGTYLPSWPAKKIVSAGCTGTRSPSPDRTTRHPIPEQVTASAPAIPEARRSTQERSCRSLRTACQLRTSATPRNTTTSPTRTSEMVRPRHPPARILPICAGSGRRRRPVTRGGAATVGWILRGSGWGPVPRAGSGSGSVTAGRGRSGPVRSRRRGGGAASRSPARRRPWWPGPTMTGAAGTSCSARWPQRQPHRCRASRSALANLRAATVLRTFSNR